MADPIDEIVGLESDTDPRDVSKSGRRAYDKARSLGVFTSANDVRAYDLSGRTYIVVAGRIFRRDTEDTSPENGVTCIIDAGGNHWRALSLETGQFRAEDYIPADQLVHIIAHDSASQDESLVTAALQSMHDDMSAAMDSGAQDICVSASYLPGVYALNGEMFSEDFAEWLWNSGGSGSSFFLFNMPGCVFQAKNWPSASAVRTSGYYSDRSIIDPVPMAMFRWEYGSTGTLGPRIIGSPMFRGEAAITDPIAIKTRAANEALFDNVMVRRFWNIGMMHEGINNSRIVAGSIHQCGYQPTQAGGNGFLSDTVRFSSVSNHDGTSTITADENVFSDDHVGLWFLLQGAGETGNMFAAKITTKTSATEVLVDRECSIDVTDAIGSFNMISGSISADSNSLALDTEVTDDLTGRYVMVIKAGSKLFTNQDILVSRVIDHDTDNKTLTLSSQARSSVSNVPVIVAPMRFFGRTDDFTNGAGTALTRINNDCPIIGQRVETYGNSNRCAVASVEQSCTEIVFVGQKLHGELQTTQNFGSAGMQRWQDNCGPMFDLGSIFSIGGWHPDYGRLCYCGGATKSFLRDVQFGSERSDHEALFYLDPKSSGVASTRVFYSGNLDNGSGAWGLTNQKLARFGTNGSINQLRSCGPFLTTGKAGYPDELNYVQNIRKTSTQTVNDSSVLVDDNELVGTLRPNQTALVTISLRYNSNSTADFKFTLTGPSGAAGHIFLGPRMQTNDVVGGGGLFALGASISVAGFGFESCVVAQAVVTLGSTGGNIVVQWAQNTANASNTTVLSNSFLRIEPFT